MKQWLKYYKKMFTLITITFLIVTACYGNFPENNYQTQAQLATSECRLVKHELGEACIPNQPQRIIVIDDILIDAVLALGIKPIAVAEADLVASKAKFFAKHLQGVTHIGKQSQPNIERIVKLRPDLIIGFLISQENYKLFSQIAPTVAVEYKQVAWKEALKTIGEIVGKKEQAQQVLAQYQQRIKKLRTALNNELSNEVSVVRFHGQLQIPEFRSQYSFPGSVLAEVGFSAPMAQRQLVNSPEDNLVHVSLERLDLLDADIVFIAVDPSAQEVFAKYRSTPLWQTLNAVKNKRVYLVDSSYWIFGNVLSAHALLDDIEDLFGDL